MNNSPKFNIPSEFPVFSLRSQLPLLGNTLHCFSRCLETVSLAWNRSNLSLQARSFARLCLVQKLCRIRRREIDSKSFKNTSRTSFKVLQTQRGNFLSVCSAPNSKWTELGFEITTQHKLFINVRRCPHFGHIGYAFKCQPSYILTYKFHDENP